MARRFPTSPSTSIDSASRLIVASPAHLTTIGVVGGAGSIGASWYSGSDISTGSLLWALSACNGISVMVPFSSPVRAACSIVVNIIGSGCAFTAWER